MDKGIYFFYEIKIPMLPKKAIIMASGNLRTVCAPSHTSSLVSSIPVSSSLNPEGSPASSRSSNINGSVKNNTSVDTNTNPVMCLPDIPFLASNLLPYIPTIIHIKDSRKKFIL